MTAQTAQIDCLSSDWTRFDRVVGCGGSSVVVICRQKVYQLLICLNYTFTPKGDILRFIKCYVSAEVGMERGMLYCCNFNPLICLTFKRKTNYNKPALL